jgi:hypothetical protein
MDQQPAPPPQQQAHAVAAASTRPKRASAPSALLRDPDQLVEGEVKEAFENERSEDAAHVNAAALNMQEGVASMLIATVRGRRSG